MDTLSEQINLLEIKEIKTKTENLSQFVIQPLHPGYGLTLGNSLRRVLLSSLQGSAITGVQIEGATHEFTTLPGLKEDVVELSLNLKTIRVKSFSEEPVILELSKKGPGEVLTGDFKKNSQVEIINPKQKIATLDKNGKLSLRVTVEKGQGYAPVEKRKEEKLTLGTIALDAIFSPVQKVRYEIDNVRLGKETDFDKLTIDILTDGSITPSEAIAKAGKILVGYFEILITKTGGEEKKEIEKETKKNKEKEKKSKQDKKEIKKTKNK